MASRDAFLKIQGTVRMTIDTNSDQYQRGLELAEAGRHAEALELIQGYLCADPDNAEVLNDAGAILHCIGRTDEAIGYFVKAVELRPDSAQIMWNLSEAYLAEGKAKEAAGLFENMERIGILNADILNRAANVFLDHGDKANAVEMLVWSLKMSSEQAVLEPMLTVIRSKRPKVAFFCGGDGMTFLEHIVQYVQHRFETRIFEGRTESELQELMEWSDISWFEWCTNLAATASNLPKTCKTIVRLHRYEAYEQWPQKVNWDNVDVLVTVGNEVTRRALVNRAPGIESRTSMEAIPNGVDLTKFTFTPRPRGKNIAFLANLRMVKNPAFMLQCMQKLHYVDPEYRLFFAGHFQDDALESYLRHMVASLGLNDVVYFDGWQMDVNDWLQDKHFIVSTSICEGQPVGILEAMACGLKPVLHNFIGAEGIFPKEYLFNISEEFCEQILSPRYDPPSYRSYVEKRYSVKRQLRSVGRLFARLEAEIESRPQPPIAIGSVGGLNAPNHRGVGIV